MKYIIQTAREDIMAWKAHQLRLVNQEETKTNVIKQLDDRSVDRNGSGLDHEVGSYEI